MYREYIKLPTNIFLTELEHPGNSDHYVAGLAINSRAGNLGQNGHCDGSVQRLSGPARLMLIVSILPAGSRIHQAAQLQSSMWKEQLRSGESVQRLAAGRISYVIGEIDKLWSKYRNVIRQNGKVSLFRSKQQPFSQLASLLSSPEHYFWQLVVVPKSN
jgi:hypothetical protein